MTSEQRGRGRRPLPGGMKDNAALLEFARWVVRQWEGHMTHEDFRVEAGMRAIDALGASAGHNEEPR